MLVLGMCIVPTASIGLALELVQLLVSVAFLPPVSSKRFRLLKNLKVMMLSGGGDAFAL